MPNEGTTCYRILVRTLYVLLLIGSIAWIGILVFGSSLSNPLGSLIGALLLTLAVLIQPFIRDPISRIVLLMFAVLSLGFITVSTIFVYEGKNPTEERIEEEEPPIPDTILRM